MTLRGKLSFDRGRFSTPALLTSLAASLQLMWSSYANAQLTPECCQIPAPTGGLTCAPTQDAAVCLRLGGQLLSGGFCDPGQLRCVRTISRHPGRFRQPHRPRPVLALGPHVPLAPTATPTPELTRSVTVLSGCCQLTSDFGPFCVAPVDSAACAHVGGRMVRDGPCDQSAGLCASLPPTRPTPVPIDLPTGCGNSIIESGEQCETDADCDSAVEGCSECQCIGAVLVTLRWANQNSIALRVIDPHGTVFVPPVQPNAGCINTTNAPDENVFFPPGRAALGCYRVEATLAQRCPEAGSVDTDLDLRLNVEGDKATTHDVPGPSIPGDTFVMTFGVRAACNGPPPLP